MKIRKEHRAFYLALAKLGLVKNPHAASLLIASGGVKIGNKKVIAEHGKRLTAKSGDKITITLEARIDKDVT